MSRVLPVSENDFRAAATDAELLRFFVNWQFWHRQGTTFSFDL